MSRDSYVSIPPRNRLEDDTVVLDGLAISFHRTVRVPDNCQLSQLPPDLGKFPLFQVKDHAEKLPRDMVAKGGIFMPMYQKEAMWIRFAVATDIHKFAIKIYVGAVNAVSGEPAVETAATALRRRQKVLEGQTVQDYIVVPNQLWLDGIATSAGEVRQFVAMTMGSGHSVEAQVTGEEVVGGLQFEITPYTPEHEVSRPRGIAREMDEVRMKIHEKGPSEMGIAAGGRIEQNIVRDPYGPANWMSHKTSTFNVQILDTASFAHVTGQPAPETPIDAATYAAMGLPFFKLEEPKSTIFGDFERVKSVAQKDKVKEKIVVVPSIKTFLFGPPKKKKKSKKTKPPPTEDKRLSAEDMAAAAAAAAAGPVSSAAPASTASPAPHIPVRVGLQPDFFNREGPKTAFRSVREIESGMMAMRSVTFG